MFAAGGRIGFHPSLVQDEPSSKFVPMRHCLGHFTNDQKLNNFYLWRAKNPEPQDRWLFFIRVEAHDPGLVQHIERILVRIAVGFVCKHIEPNFPWYASDEEKRTLKEYTYQWRPLTEDDSLFVLPDYEFLRKETWRRGQDPIFEQPHDSASKLYEQITRRSMYSDSELLSLPFKLTPIFMDMGAVPPRLQLETPVTVPPSPQTPFSPTTELVEDFVDLGVHEKDE